MRPRLGLSEGVNQPADEDDKSLLISVQIVCTQSKIYDGGQIYDSCKGHFYIVIFSLGTSTDSIRGHSASGTIAVSCEDGIQSSSWFIHQFQAGRERI